MAFGFFDTSYKPDARSFNVQAADLDSILKTGMSIYGEWFLKGKRLLGGRKRGELPDGITDYDAPQPLFPQIKRAMEITDGAPTQFDNKNHYHQTASWMARLGIRRSAIKLITMHGKSVCDGASNSPKLALAQAGDVGALVTPGARGAALYLAQHKPDPSKAKLHGGGYWQADTILYGFYEPTLFTATAVPDALPFPGSSKVHMSAGMCDDMARAQTDGPLVTLDVFCPCEPCCRLQFSSCEMKEAFGSVKTVSVKRSSSTGLPSQSAGLAEFAATLDVNQIVAFRVASDEANIEGCVWLALLDGKAFGLQQDELHAGQHFEKGWTVVRGHWFAYQRTVPATGARIYKALEEETLLNVQSMIRLTNIKFIQSVPRRTRGSTSEWYKQSEFTLSDEVYQKLLDSCL
jgi:hypothetical protein